MTSDNPDADTGKRNLSKKISDIFDKFKKRNEVCGDDFFSSPHFLDLESSKQKMIKGIIDLPETNVREIMIPRVDVLTLPYDAKLNSIVKKVYDSGFSRIPVFKNSIDNIIGILYVKDLLKFILEKQKNFQLEKLLHKPYYVPETMPLDDLLLEFKKKKLHLAVVVDEYGGMSGVITLEDIIEEIVGDIEDEFDDEVPDMHKIRQNVYSVDPRMAICDFNEETGTKIPDNEFDTIGGFVFDLFGKVPRKDETVKYENIVFKVSDVKGARINKITITVPNGEQNG